MPRLSTVFPAVLVVILFGAIVVLVAQFNQVTYWILGTVLIFLGLGLAYSRHEMGVSALALLTLLTALMASVALVADRGGIWPVLAVIVWIFLAVLLYRWYANNSYRIQQGVMLLINRYSGEAAYGPKTLLFPPVLPGEEIVAKLPTRDIESRLKVEHISTPSEKKLTSISFRVKYKIDSDGVNPDTGRIRAFEFYENASQNYEFVDEERERGKGNGPPAWNPAYWQRTLKEQVRQFVDDTCRTIVPRVIADPKELSTPRPASTPARSDAAARPVASESAVPGTGEAGAATKPGGDGRYVAEQPRNAAQEEIEREMREEFDSQARILGLIIKEPLTITEREINMEHLRNPADKKRREAELDYELEVKRIRAIGQAQAEAQATAVEAIMEALRMSEAGRHISPDELRTVVRLALEDLSDRRWSTEAASRSDIRQRS